MDKFIFEVVVYDGQQKVFRVLNLSTGTVYSNHHETLEKAEASIEDGVKRAGKTVKRVHLQHLNHCLTPYTQLLERILKNQKVYNKKKAKEKKRLYE